MATQQIRTAIEAAKNVADESDKVQWATELLPILKSTLREIDTLDSTLAARRDVTVPIQQVNNFFSQSYNPNYLSLQDVGFDSADENGNGIYKQYPICVKTNIPESSCYMFTLTMKGYHFRTSESIAFSVSAYTFNLQHANIDTTRKGLMHIAFEKNTDFSFPIGIGISDDGFVTLKIGDVSTQWYYLFLNFDVEIHCDTLANAITPPQNWSVQTTPVAFVDYHDLTATILKKTMTYAERMLLTPPLRQVGIEVYQTDSFGSELEGKYLYKSTGWTYIG